jgi:site-specific DNA-adenine methylase
VQNLNRKLKRIGLQHLQHLERLQHLQHLERLQHLQHLELSSLSYEQVQTDGVIYCDPPYLVQTKDNKVLQRENLTINL